jgi:hypothetical protein
MKKNSDLQVHVLKSLTHEQKDMLIIEQAVGKLVKDRSMRPPLCRGAARQSVTGYLPPVWHEGSPMKRLPMRKPLL